jgi:hypothetical protein
LKAVAEEVGLEVCRDPPFGWSRTVLPADTAASYDATLAALARELAPIPIPSPHRGDVQRGLGRTALTLVCECGRRTRSGRTVPSLAAAICGVCGGGALER